MEKSNVSFEDFLKQLSEIRFNLEVDHHVHRVDRHVHRVGSREKICPPAAEASSPKSSKRDSFMVHVGGRVDAEGPP